MLLWGNNEVLPERIHRGGHIEAPENIGVVHQKQNNGGEGVATGNCEGPTKWHSVNDNNSI